TGVEVPHLPGGDPAVAAGARADVDDGGRPEVALTELILAAPADLDRRVRRACQTRSLDRDLGGMLPAEPPAEVRHDDPDRRLGDAQGRRDLLANPEWNLGPCPDREAAVGRPRGNGGPRLEWHMGDVGSPVRRLDSDLGGRQGLIDVAARLAEATLPAFGCDGMGTEVRFDIGLAWLVGKVPLGLGA